MTSETRQLVEHRLDRARQVLSDADALRQQGRLLSAVNRYYYAAFHAVHALLLSKGLASAKHTGVRSLFHLHFVKEGLVPERHGMFYNQLFSARQQADYEDYVQFDSKRLSEWAARTAEFVEVMGEAARRIISDLP